MGYVASTSVKRRPVLLENLPSGSFTVDSAGRILACTVTQQYSRERLREMGRLVVTLFQSARDGGLSLNELVVNYSAMKLIAREMRGGAIVFLTPLGNENGAKLQPQPVGYAC